MTKDIKQRIKEIEEIKSLKNPYDWDQSSCHGKSKEEWFYDVQKTMAKQALEVINHLQSEVESYKSLDEWQPIETCPEDQYVFVWVKSVENLEYGKRIEVCKTKNHSTGWAGVGDLDYYNLEKGIIYFSHWRPLPKPPKQSH